MYMRYVSKKHVKRDGLVDRPASSHMCSAMGSKFVHVTDVESLSQAESTVLHSGRPLPPRACNNVLQFVTLP